MGRRIYEKLYDGELWERKYRSEASNITRGLRNVCKNVAIFPIGKEEIKTTEIEWLRHNPDWDKNPRPYVMHHNWIWEIATSHKLPWKEECWENNLKIIRKAVRKTLKMNKSESSFEEYLDEAIDSYPRKIMTKEFKTYRVFAKCTTYYENTYEAETREEAMAIAEQAIEEDFPYYNELSNDEPEIFDTSKVV